MQNGRDDSKRDTFAAFHRSSGRIQGSVITVRTDAIYSYNLSSVADTQA